MGHLWCCIDRVCVFVCSVWCRVWCAACVVVCGAWDVNTVRGCSVWRSVVSWFVVCPWCVVCVLMCVLVCVGVCGCVGVWCCCCVWHAEKHRVCVQKRSRVYRKQHSTPHHTNTYNTETEKETEKERERKEDDREETRQDKTRNTMTHVTLLFLNRQKDNSQTISRRPRYLQKPATWTFQMVLNSDTREDAKTYLTGFCTNSESAWNFAVTKWVFLFYCLIPVKMFVPHRQSYFAFDWDAGEDDRPVSRSLDVMTETA